MSIPRRRWPAVAQFWFEEPIPARGVDVAFYCQRAQPIAGSRSSRPYHTLLIDLTRPEAEIEAGFTKETRYEIRRAETKDALDVRQPFDPDPGAVREFHEFFSAFCRSKNLGGIGLEYLLSAQGANHLRLSTIAHQGNTLVWHSYIATPTRVRLMHSASLLSEADSARRALVGRANRLLHWLDMKAFKQQGVSTYDFGGWFHGRDKNGQPKTNQFKASFGGTRLTEYDGVVACSAVGRMYLWLRSLRK